MCARTKEAWDPGAILNPGVKLAAEGSALAPGELKVGPEAPVLSPDIAAQLREIERSAGWGRFRLDLAPAAAS